MYKLRVTNLYHCVNLRTAILWLFLMMDVRMTLGGLDAENVRIHGVTGIADASMMLIEMQ